MNNVISFTPIQLIELVLAICAGICTVAAAIGIIIAAVKKMKTPNEIQDKRIDTLEERVDRHDEIFAKDNRRLEAIEDGNRVTQRAILSLLSHTIDGSDIEPVKHARTEMTEFLIKR